MNREGQPIPFKSKQPNVLEQANDVIFQKFAGELRHGVGCGCGSCMGAARKTFDWYVGDNLMSVPEKNTAIKNFVEATKGGVVVRFNKKPQSPLGGNAA